MDEEHTPETAPKFVNHSFFPSFFFFGLNLDRFFVIMVFYFYFFWFSIHTDSETSTTETCTDGDAIIRKPRSAWLEGTPAISVVFMFGFTIDVLK